MLPDERDLIDRVAETLKEPVRIDPNLDRRVMAEIERLPDPAGGVPAIRSMFEWLTRRRTVTLSPLSGLAAAAGLVAVVVAGTLVLGPRNGGAPSLAAGGPEPTVIQFVLVSPGAATVSLVGDFNDWDMEATPLEQDPGRGVWSVTVPLAPGRYRYAFLVDGTTWLKDPRGAPALEDEFGRPNSVLTIGGA
jgi:hypothetical protein